mgnify:CR=1 FL=1
MTTKVLYFTPAGSKTTIRGVVSYDEGDIAVVGIPILTNDTGEIDESLIPAEFKTSGIFPIDIVASGNLTAGKLVHFYRDGGVFKAKPASSVGKLDAHGYITQDIADGQAGVAFNVGVIEVLSGLVPGDEYYLSADGNVTNDIALVLNSHSKQRVGIATTETNLAFAYSEPTRLCP